MPPPNNPIAALAEALKMFLPHKPATTLETPTFKWSSTAQYEEFQLFHESIKSWFCLHSIQMNLTAKVSDWNTFSISLVSLDARNGMNGKFTALTLKLVQLPKSAKGFQDHFMSKVDHTVPQQCGIYQLEDVHISQQKPQMNWLIICGHLPTNAFSQHMRKSRQTSSFDLSKP